MASLTIVHSRIVKLKICGTPVTSRTLSLRCAERFLRGAHVTFVHASIFSGVSSW
jgi:hypothetical protein